MATTTSAGSTIAISPALPAAETEAGYGAVTFVDIGQVEKIGSIGAVYAKTEFQPLFGPKMKFKGSADFGSLQPSLAHDESDAGQAILRAAADSPDLFSFRVTYPTGAKRYFEGRVFGYPETTDGADAMLLVTPTIEICTKVVKVGATGAIILPTVSISGALSKSEGNSGTLAFTYIVTLSQAAGSGGVAVPWALAYGSTDSADFASGQATSGTLTIAAGQTSGMVTINAVGDTTLEGDETFTFLISTPTGYLAGAATSATGTILNDDAPPAPTFSSLPSISPTSGTAGTTTFAATDGVATNATSISRRWLLGTTSIGTGTTVVAPTGGQLTLENTAAGPGGSKTVISGAITVAALAAPTLSISSAVAQNEGNSGTTAFAWTLTLNRDGSTDSYPFNWAVAGSGANPASASDFGGVFPSGSGTFAAGETSKTILVLAAGDTAVESNETFTLTVDATGLNTVTSTGTINNDDVATSTLSISGMASTATVGSPCNFTPAVSGGAGGNVFSSVGATLPSAFSFNTSTGAITTSSPTPEGTTNGVAIRVTDSAGATATLTFNLIVAPASANLTASPNPASFTAGAASGTTVFSIANVPAGVTPAISPADGKVVIGGNATNGWKGVVGLTASTASQTAVNYIVTATGRSSVTVPVTVNAASGEGAYTAMATEGKMTFANTATGNGGMDEGYPWPVTIPKHAELSTDFSNLRIYDQDKTTALAFTIDQSQILFGTSCVAYVRLPAIAAGATRVLYYDAGAQTAKSDGEAVFGAANFTAARSGTIDTNKVDMATVGNATISAQKGLRVTRRWKKSDLPGKSGIQTGCNTPYGIWLAYLPGGGGTDATSLILVDAVTGATKTGTSIPTGPHAYSMSYDPEQDVIILMPSGAGTGVTYCWVHRASDGVCIGGLYGDSTTSFRCTYSGPGQVVSTADGAYWSVDWSNKSGDASFVFPMTKTGVVRAPTGTNFAGGETAQGYGYNLQEQALYSISNSSGGSNTVAAPTQSWLRRWDMSGTKGAANSYLTGLWRNPMGDADGVKLSSNYEAEGVYIDPVTGAGIITALDRADDTCVLLDVQFTTARENADYHGQGICLVCPNTANQNAFLTLKQKLVGPSRIIHMFRSLTGQANVTGPALPTHPRFGMTNAAAGATTPGDRLASFTRLSASDAGTVAKLRRAAPNATAVTTNTTQPINLINRANYEILWDGTTVKYRQNGAAVGTAAGYTDAVPPLADAGLMAAHVDNLTGSPTVNGSVIIMYGIAQGKYLPAGQAEPTVTVA